jgi:hypothetical protein
MTVFGDNRERPTHPDFTRLIDGILWLDGQTSEGRHGFEDVVSACGFDVDLVMRTVTQQTRTAIRGTVNDSAARGAIWIDGYLTGVRFADPTGQVPPANGNPAIVSRQRHALKASTAWYDTMNLGAELRPAVERLPVNLEAVIYCGRQRALRLRTGHHVPQSDLTVLWCAGLYIGVNTASVLAR